MREGDPGDFVRYIFEMNACLLTEAQSLKIYLEEGFGLMKASNAEIAVSYREDVELVAREPYRYLFSGSKFCSF